MKSADAVVYGSPVYYASPSGEMLMFLDRLYGLAEAELLFKPASERASPFYTLPSRVLRYPF